MTSIADTSPLHDDMQCRMSDEARYTKERVLAREKSTGRPVELTKMVFRHESSCRIFGGERY